MFFQKFFCLVLAVLFVNTDYRNIENTSFEAGEAYSYKIKYGFLTIGEADVNVDKKIFIVNSRPCYKVTVLGRTAGMTTLWKVSNTYISYIDTAAFLPQKFIYSARENSYKRDQTMVFDHPQNEVKHTEKDFNKNYKIPQNTLDVVSGYYFLRMVDFSKYNVGQTYSSPLFFDEQLYNMKIKYAGKGTVNNRNGKIKVLKLNPILPQNKMFKGENAMRIWVSDDQNRVPIKIEVEFPFGTIDMDLKSFSGNKHAFDWK